MHRNNYLYSIYIVLGIISHLEMILSIWKNVNRLYANTMVFYIRDLNIWRFLYYRRGWGYWNQSCGYWGTIVLGKITIANNYKLLLVYHYEDPLLILSLNVSLVILRMWRRERKNYNFHSLTLVSLPPLCCTALIVPNERKVTFLGLSCRQHFK
jgi:hypothetical protein